MLLLVAIGLAMLPLALTLLYRLEFTRPVSMLMLVDRFTFRPFHRQWIDIDDVAPVLVQSVIMSEDGQFCSHQGVDWGALNEVINEALEGERARGASTITMQTVKNLFLWNSRSFIRKGLEIPLAIWFDLVVPKKRVLEIYLNIAEWGIATYGVAAASQAYFGKHPTELSPREAALLTVALPNPKERNPASPGPGMSRLADIIQARAAKAGGHTGCLD
ncbi:biosynthetic peptidoglycan transglycosylase [Oricola cellulosilytica]|uniref:Biosynthetic peptidoglycan transglycosylase n=1 Tax=Oricola cellulosilytica TaxID=1429082 RepID=A0A4R0PGD0_9HYPH|nr:transglycosylase domain-containing protein [Oricola cellulosilytica]TCD15973.1 monofunctional biosynthetic peptidoglycan transglycosylase [Oricola cellulosilytica]